MDNTRFVFVKNALEKIISFRDARKNKLLNEIAIAILGLFYFILLILFYYCHYHFKFKTHIYLFYLFSEN